MRHAPLDGSCRGRSFQAPVLLHPHGAHGRRRCRYGRRRCRYGRRRCRYGCRRCRYGSAVPIWLSAMPIWPSAMPIWSAVQISVGHAGRRARVRDHGRRQLRRRARRGARRLPGAPARSNGDDPERMWSVFAYADRFFIKKRLSAWPRRCLRAGQCTHGQAMPVHGFFGPKLYRP